MKKDVKNLYDGQYVRIDNEWYILLRVKNPTKNLPGLTPLFTFGSNSKRTVNCLVKSLHE